jgi:N-acetylmuramic acid 6-phosphate etherase
MVIGLIAGGKEALTRAVEGAEDHPEAGRRDLADISLTDRDVVVGIATSGRTPYVIGALLYAAEVGAYTIGFACNEVAELQSHCQLMIAPIVGPEVISGSTRMKAGTATKMVLNMLTTGAMVRLGKTYGNLMVDLRATNAKLTLRSKRIVAELAGLTTDEASDLLARCDGEVKTAIVAARLGTSAVEARKRLRDADGHLRAAIQQLETRSPDAALSKNEQLPQKGTHQQDPQRSGSIEESSMHDQ